MLTAAGVTPRHCAIFSRAIERIASSPPIQEWAVEARGRRAAATWPECPQHPGSHPLMAAVREGRAVWICPRTGDLVSDVGRLRAPHG